MMEGIVQNQKITSSVSLPGLVTEQLLTNDDHEIFAGKLKAEKDLWLAKGGFFTVINTKTGKLVASKTFTNNVFQVTCAAEYDNNIVFLGLKSDSGAGCVGLFNVQAAKVEKTWELAHGVTSITVLNVDANPLRAAIGEHRILLAVGTQEGHVLLLALTTLNQIQGGTEDEEELDSDDTSVITYLSLRDLKTPQNWPTNADLALPLNDSAYHRSTFVYVSSKNDRATLVPADIAVTSLRCIPATESLLVGFSFGGFQMWSLETLALMYVSPYAEDGLPPVVDFLFQEPDDDPRNFCYVWVVQSEADVGSYASLYSFGFARKYWDADGKAYYEDLQSCNLRLEIDVAAVFTDMDLLDEGECRLVSCSTMQPPSLAESCESRAPVPSQALFVWEVKGETISYYATLFDLNQWYHEHMPTVWKFEANTLCPFLGFFHIQLESYQRVIAAWPKNHSLAWFATKTSQEQFAYPSSLAYDLALLVRSGIVTCKFVGLQLNLLNRLKSEGPALLLQPSDFYCKAVKVGLIPEATELLTQKGIREVLLTMALDYDRLSFLQDCVSQWADGSYLGSGCSLAFLEQWAWSNLGQAKQTWDTISRSLYDQSNELDDLKKDELHSLSSKIGHLAAILAVIDTHAKKRFDYGNLQMECKAKAAELLATYCKTVLWFVFAGLLPEDAEDASNDTLTFPAQELNDFYTKRRQEIERLSSSIRANEVLLIDVLSLEGDNALGATWSEFGGKNALYPPPSYEALLAGYLNGEVDLFTKHRLVQYLFLDLASLKSEEKYLEQVEHLITFPSTYSLPPSVIKLTQAFWLLDHQDFEEALTVLLDPLVLPSDVTLGQHKAIIKSFLYQGHPRLALKYATLRKLAHPDAEQTRLHLTVLLACGLVTDALQHRRHHAAQDKDGDLMQHFLEACHQLQKLHLVLQLPLHQEEEESLIAFLNKINTLAAKELLLMFYLQRSRFAEVNALHMSLNRGWPAFDPLSKEKQLMRNTIVSGYLHVLPQLTSQLATLPTTQLTTQAVEKRPHPLSTTAKAAAGRPIFTSSGLICQAMEKARATWTEKALEPQTPFRKRKTAAPTLDSVPFLCGLLTPRAKDHSTVVDDELPSAKRQRTSFNAEVPRPVPKSVTRLNEEVRTLLRTPPVVKRRSSVLAGVAGSVSTPHSSILKGKPASIADEDQEGSVTSHGTEKHLRFALPRTSSEVSDIVNQSLASIGELERVEEVSGEEIMPVEGQESSLAIVEEQASLVMSVNSMNQSGQDEFVSFEESESNEEMNESQVSEEVPESEGIVEEDLERTKESVEIEDGLEEEARDIDERPVESLESGVTEENHEDQEIQDEEEEGEGEDEEQVEAVKKKTQESDDEIVVLSSSEDESRERSFEDKEDSREWGEEAEDGEEDEESAEEEESEEEATTSEDSSQAVPALGEDTEAKEEYRLRLEESEESEREDHAVADVDEDTVENVMETAETSVLEESVEEEAQNEEGEAATVENTEASVLEESVIEGEVQKEGKGALEESEDSADIYEDLGEENEPRVETNVNVEDLEEPIMVSQVTETVIRVEERVTSEGTVKITEEMRLQKFQEQRLVFSDSEAEEESNEKMETSEGPAEASASTVNEDEPVKLGTPTQEQDTGISDAQEQTPSAMEESVVEIVAEEMPELGVMTQSSMETTDKEAPENVSGAEQPTVPSVDDKFEANRLRFENSEDEEEEEETGTQSEDQSVLIVESVESSLPVESTKSLDRAEEQIIQEAEPIPVTHEDSGVADVEKQKIEVVPSVDEEDAQKVEVPSEDSLLPVQEINVGLIQSQEESPPVQETHVETEPLQDAAAGKIWPMGAESPETEPRIAVDSSAMELTEIENEEKSVIVDKLPPMDITNVEPEPLSVQTVAEPQETEPKGTQYETEPVSVQTEAESQETQTEATVVQPESSQSETCPQFAESAEAIERVSAEPNILETTKTTRRRRSSRLSSQDSTTRTIPRRTRRRSVPVEEDAADDASMDVSTLETLVGAEEEDNSEEVTQMVTRSISRNSRNATPEPHRMTRRSSVTPSRDLAQKLGDETPDWETESLTTRLRRTPTRELRNLRQTTSSLEEPEVEDTDSQKRSRKTPTRELRSQATPLLEEREEVENVDSPKRSRKSQKETRKSRESSESRESVPPSPLRRVSRRVKSDSSPESVASGVSEALSTTHYALRSRPSTSTETSPVKRRSESSTIQSSPVASTSRVTRRRSVSKTVEVPLIEEKDEEEETEVEVKPKTRGRPRSSSIEPLSADPIPEDRPASRTRSRQSSLTDVRETEEGSDSDGSNASFTSTASEPVRKRRRGKRDVDEEAEERDATLEEGNQRMPALKRKRASSEEPQQITRRSLRPRKSVLAQPPALEPILEADNQLGSSVSNLSEEKREEANESSTRRGGRRVNTRRSSQSVFRQPKKRHIMRI